MLEDDIFSNRMDAGAEPASSTKSDLRDMQRSFLLLKTC